MAQIAIDEAYGYPLGIAPLARPGAYQEVVHGKVTGPDGSPVPGANVSIKGSKKGVTTGTDGSFTINASKGDILVISSIGYAAQQVKVGSGDLAVSLLESSKQLNEVVVTALGIKKQARSLGYSTTEVNGSALTDSREQNLGNALTGQVAGVNVAGVANGPMGTSRVVIRGNSSLTGNNQPLYVIDGVPFDNQNLGGNAGQWGGADFGDGLSGISPDDIESIQVLKGVAASALYGFRGGNGAILITTKSGARNRGMNIELNNNLVFNSVMDERDYQYTYGQGLLGVKPTSQAAALAAPYDSWGAKIDGSQAVNFLGQPVAYTAYKKNFENFFKTATTNQTSVALSGSNDKGHFRLGLSNSYNGVVIPNSNMKNQALNFNGTFNVTNRLQMTLTADYAFEQVQNRASFSDAPGNVIAGPLYLANTFDIRWLKNNQTNPNGSELLPGTDIYFENPYYIAYQYQNKTSRNRLTGGLTVKYNILDWLYLQGQVTRDGYIYDVTNITPSGVPYTGNGVTGGNLTQYEINYHELNSSAMVGIDKALSSRFHLTANAGVNQQDNVISDYGVGAVPTLVNGINPQGPAGPFTISGLYTANNIANKPAYNGYAHYRVNSVYGSVDLGYKNFLFLTATARNDWFSTLSVNSDHYLYPSVAGSFVFSDALRLPSWITFGKLRASYAAASNGTSPYQNALLYNLASYTISGQSVGTVATNIIPDAHLEPVKIAEQEVGLNMDFLDSRVGFDVAVYNKHTTDDIVQSTVSPTSGYNYQVQNIGQIRNRGVELLINLTPVRSRDFTWHLTFNYAHNNNKVLSLGGLPSLVINGAYPRWGSEVNISNVVGLPYSQIMGFAYTKDAKGNIVYSSGGANPVAAGEPIPTQVVPLGSGVYTTTGGFFNEFTYKGITLSFLLDGKFGAKIYSGTNLLLYEYGLQKTTLQGRESGYIGKGVDDKGNVNTTAVAAQTYFQDISAGGADHIAQEFVYDASFIKLRSLSIGYSLPSSVLGHSFVKGVRLSLVGRNLAILMKHVPNIDPESNLNATNGQGLELSGFPAFRSYGFNVNVKF
ncbi:SusC/RagA family TonB-linked outer membrane protein [Dinghuibacter silviterrae]|nr:SusC/RagA family TonB-linked outer membrane protein [Dinghuibacter silviterrae]